MQMIVPAKGKNSAYQVFIIAGDLSKEETEKNYAVLSKIIIESQNSV